MKRGLCTATLRAADSRNVLVFAFDAEHAAASSVKITDFGPAVNRRYDQTHGTVQSNHGPPEAPLLRQVSDVWAFGVTAWERLTGGDMPFAFISSNEEVAERVCRGERLPCPQSWPPAMWKLQQRMWADKSTEQPTLIELEQDFVALLSADWSDLGEHSHALGA